MSNITCRKSIEHISTHIHGKISQQTKNKRKLSNLMKGIYQKKKKITANIRLNGEGLNIRLGKKQGGLLC